ncbi:MAG: 4Fe-4S binding protein [Chloroflexi bacterium]|nr:4Fe-4S binding protein [Chloroflexota bacterium]
MWLITIDPDKCQGDGECGDVCPVTILSVVEVGGKKITQVTGNADDCMGCSSCVATCTHEAITVVEM